LARRLETVSSIEALKHPISMTNGAQAASGAGSKGAGALQPYLDAVAATLEASMCLQDFASMEVERHSKPEVEINSGKEVLLKPLVVARSTKEKVLIEPSINSVRVSIMIK